VLKDRLYSSAPDAHRRRSAQSALFEMFRTMSVLLAPILSFTAEEAWQHLQPELRGESGSIFDVAFPRVEAVDEDALASWALLKGLRGQVASSEGVRDFQLDASVDVQQPFYDRFVELGDNLREALVVSALRGVTPSANGASTVALVPAAGEKCQRCWKYLPLGSDPEHPTLCESCAGIVRELEAQGAAR
jgi:isoleucyl-tRNA synthetase